MDLTKTNNVIATFLQLNIDDLLSFDETSREKKLIKISREMMMEHFDCDEQKAKNMTVAEYLSLMGGIISDEFDQFSDEFILQEEMYNFEVKCLAYAMFHAEERNIPIRLLMLTPVDSYFRILRFGIEEFEKSDAIRRDWIRVRDVCNRIYKDKNNIENPVLIRDVLNYLKDEMALRWEPFTTSIDDFESRVLSAYEAVGRLIVNPLLLAFPLNSKEIERKYSVRKDNIYDEAGDEHDTEYEDNEKNNN